MAPAGIYLRIERSDDLTVTSVRIEIAYDPAKLPKGITEDDLRLYRYNEETKRWDLVAAAEKQGIGKEKKILWAELDDFSEFGIFATPVEPQPDADLPRTAPALPYLFIFGLFMISVGFLLSGNRGCREGKITILPELNTETV